MSKKKGKSISKIREYLAEIDEDFLLIDDRDSAIIGIGKRCGMPDVVVYDQDKLIKSFMKDGMTFEEAIEWIDYNIIGAYVGERTPIVVEKIC